MGEYNIPKLSRNKYNFVKGLDGENYITTSQMMMSSSNGGGATGGTNMNNVVAYNISSAIKANCDTVQDACYAYTYLIQQQVENDINDTSASAY